MEYVPGGSVQDRLRAGPAGVVLAKRWAHDALEALARAHAEGIVHRDVRPSNLLLDGTGHAMLSDFGVSADTIRGVLASGEAYLGIAPPEFLAGDTITPQTDVWAIGCLIYVFVTGRYPHDHPDGGTPSGYELLHRVDVQVPLALSRVVDRALKANRADRYRDAGQMLSELSPQPIHNSWTAIDDAAVVHGWETTTRTGRFYRA
jgi:serine/threonine protein kinase